MLRALVLALALAAAPGHVVSQQKLRVVTTSADLKSLVDAVGGTRVDVYSLAAPEQDPHAIELKPSSLARTRGAEMLVRIGLDHEPWLTKLRLPESVVIVDASRSARLIQTQMPRLRVERRAHVHAFGNTHYWLDPTNAAPITAAIRDALVKLSPQDALVFDTNRSAFINALNIKIEGWKKVLAPFRDAKMIVMHDSWSYFAEQFGLQIVAAAEPQPGVPPSPAELSALFQHMRDAGVKILIADPHSNPSLVRQIATKSGAHAVTLSPSGDDYVQLFDHNVAKLVEALKRGGP